ncbi:MAG: PqqD family protein [Sulfurovum sp.]|nr:PqqD family protein [Sulfurovum sp.]
MSFENKVYFSDTVFAQEVDGEMVLLDMNSENYFGLDAVGTSIWRAIEQEKGDLAKVFGVLLDMYDVDEEILKKDLMIFVKRLQESGLVEVEPL